jgi:predicted metalloprotease
MMEQATSKKFKRNLADRLRRLVMNHDQMVSRTLGNRNKKISNEKRKKRLKS